MKTFRPTESWCARRSMPTSAPTTSQAWFCLRLHPQDDVVRVSESSVLRKASGRGSPPEGFRLWALYLDTNFSSAGYSTTGSPYKPSGRPRRRMRVWLNASHGATPRRVVGLLVHTSTITSPHAMPTYSTFMYAWLLLVRAWTWLLAIICKTTLYPLSTLQKLTMPTPTCCRFGLK